LLLSLQFESVSAVTISVMFDSSGVLDADCHMVPLSFVEISMRLFAYFPRQFKIWQLVEGNTT
jgi:hypothetical protein